METFTVREGPKPTANLANPASGADVDLTLLNARKYFDVTFNDFSGMGIDPASILDSQPEFTLAGTGVADAGKPFAVSGSTATINNTVWAVPTDDFRVVWLTSMRMIIDLADLTGSVAINTTGQSGHAYSEHYDDMIDLWRKVEYHPMLWTRQQVDEAAVNRLILTP